MLEIQKSEHSVQAGIEKTLKGYLAGATQFIGNSTKEVAGQRAEEYASGADFSSFKSNPDETAKAIANKEKELKAAAKKASFQAKMNYAFDERATSEMDGLAQHILIGAATVGMTMSMAVGGSAEGAVMSGMAGMVAAVTLSTGRWLSRAENKEEAKQIDDYATIKHAQLALKQLKKEIAPLVSKNERVPSSAELLAGGLGNPGGMISPIMLSKKSQTR